jgi:hypothetical protein
MTAAGQVVPLGEGDLEAARALGLLHPEARGTGYAGALVTELPGLDAALAGPSPVLPDYF